MFNPKKPGPMKAIAEVGSSEYYLCAAKVCIDEVLAKQAGPANVIRAIQLLILAEVWRKNNLWKG